MAKRARGKSRAVPAPEPELMAGEFALNRVLTVRLKPGEDVEWFWTSLAQGARYVSGYRILRMMDEGVASSIAMQFGANGCGKSTFLKIPGGELGRDAVR